jgi:predicted transcriptional regulator
MAKVEQRELAIYELLKTHGCMTTSQIMGGLGLSHTQAFYTLNKLVELGAVAKHIVGGRIALWCAKHIDPLRKYEIVFKTIGYDMRRILARLMYVLQSVKSKRWCIKVAHAGIPPLEPVTKAIFLDMLLDLLDSSAELVLRRAERRARTNRAYVCIDDVDAATAKIRDALARLGVEWIYA